MPLEASTSSKTQSFIADYWDSHRNGDGRSQWYTEWRFEFMLLAIPQIPIASHSLGHAPLCLTHVLAFLLVMIGTPWGGNLFIGNWPTVVTLDVESLLVLHLPANNCSLSQQYMEYKLDECKLKIIWVWTTIAKLATWYDIWVWNLVPSYKLINTSRIMFCTSGSKHMSTDVFRNCQW